MLLWAGAACSAAGGRLLAANATVANLPAATLPTPGCLASHDGYLRLRMRGASNMDIDWHDADMQCDGGPRPGQQGLRLTFAGPAPGTAPGAPRGGAIAGAHTLRFVFGIATAPGVRSAHNVPTNVTVIFEGRHKLFSTAGDGKCTIDEFSEQPLASQYHSRLHRISARGFCIAPATALAGSSAVLLSRFDFAGAILDEDPSDEPSAAGPPAASP
jgi:hypothetical protein